MSTILKHKRSSSSSSVPNANDLSFGEIAINTYDKKLFFKANDGTGDTIVALEPSSSSGSNATLASQLATTSTYTGDGSTVVYAIGSTPDSVDNVLVTIDGVTQVPTTDYTVSGSTLTFTTAPLSGDGIMIRNYRMVGTNTQLVTNVKFHFIPTTSTTTLSGTDSNGNTLKIHPSNSMLFLNGAKLVHGDDYSINSAGDTITLVSSVSSPDEIEIHSFGTATLLKIEDIEEVGMLHSVQKTSRISSTSTSTQMIDEVDITLFRGCKYIITGKDTVSSKFHIVEILAIHDDTNVYLTEYGEVLSSTTSVGSFSVDISSGNMRLTVDPSSTNASVFTVHRVGIEV